MNIEKKMDTSSKHYYNYRYVPLNGNGGDITIHTLVWNLEQLYPEK